MSKDLQELESGTFARVNSNNEIEVVCEKTGQVVATQGGLRNYIDQLKQPFDSTLADIICNRIIEGEPLTKICKDPIMPSFSTISRWRKNHEDFDSAIKYAYQERAHYFHDKAIEVVEDTFTKDEVSVNRLKSETYKWAAERGNQEQFGAKQSKVEGVAVSTQIIVTGVPQPDSVDVTPKPITITASEGDSVGQADAGLSNVITTATGGGEPDEA